MSRLTAVLLTMLIAAGAAAQSADVRTSISAPKRVDRGEPINWAVTFENAGPDPARNVRVSADFASACVNELIATFAPGERRTFNCRKEPPEGYAVQLIAEAHVGGTPDPDRDNNRAYAEVEIMTPPDLLVQVSAPQGVEPGQPFDFAVAYKNLARTAATDVTMQVTVTGAAIASAPRGCTVAGNAVTCVLGSVLPDPQPFDRAAALWLTFTAVAPDASKAPMSITASISGNETDVAPSNNDSVDALATHQTIVVTNTNDSGSGSLRAAIEEMNATCTTASAELCKINFRIPPGSAQWVTIQPETPLPAVTADRVIVDGQSQTRFADTNPLGPEVELSGARLSRGGGLTLASPCGASVVGFAINGFSDNGVFITGACEDRNGGGLRGVRENYIGTDPTGTRAVPNLRGVMVAPSGRDYLSPTIIESNVISGNRYSGIWVSSGMHTRIRRNIIGLTAGATAGLGNGSSGVYIGPAGSGTDLSQNHIGFNGHYGLSLDRDTVQVEASANSFQANGNLAIDHGLDGMSPAVPDVGQSRGNLLLHAPRITSARYDAASNTTIIEGTLDVANDPGVFRYFSVQLYANDAPDESGFGEGQYPLGAVRPDASGRFTYVHQGRTPGRWIAATANSAYNWGFARTPKIDANLGGYSTTTSEFSRTVEVSQ